MERGRGDECRREASGKLRPGMSATSAQEQAIPCPADDGDCHGHTEPDAVTSSVPSVHMGLSWLMLQGHTDGKPRSRAEELNHCGSKGRVSDLLLCPWGSWKVFWTRKSGYLVSSVVSTPWGTWCHTSLLEDSALTSDGDSFLPGYFTNMF